MEFSRQAYIKGKEMFIFVITKDGDKTIFAESSDSHDELVKKHKLEEPVTRGYVGGANTVFFVSSYDVQFDLIGAARKVSEEVLKYASHAKVTVHIETPSVTKEFDVGEAELERVV